LTAATATANCDLNGVALIDSKIYYRESCTTAIAAGGTISSATTATTTPKVSGCRNSITLIPNYTLK
jgi:hypothetical protein